MKQTALTVLSLWVMCQSYFEQPQWQDLNKSQALYQYFISSFSTSLHLYPGLILAWMGIPGHNSIAPPEKNAKPHWLQTLALVQLLEHPEVPVPHLGALRMPISVSGMFLLLSISPSPTPFTPAAYTHSSNSSFPETFGNHPLMFPYCTTYMLLSPPISQL